MPASGVSSAPTIPARPREGALQAGGVVVGREPAGLLDRERGAVPIGVLLVAIEQHAELVDAVGDLVLVENDMLVLHHAGAAEQLMQRQHRVVAGVIGVGAGGGGER